MKPGKEVVAFLVAAGATTAAWAEPARRLFFPSKDERPAAVQIVFDDAVSKAIYPAIGNPVFSIAYEIPNGASKGDLRIIGAETVAAIPPGADKTEKMIVADNRTGRPTFVLHCSEPNAGKPRCSVWMWVWPADKLEGPHKDAQLQVKREKKNGAKYLRLEILDGADAFSLYKRLNFPPVDELDDRFKPARRLTSKSVTVGRQEEFVLSCAEWEPRPNKSYACHVEVRLDAAHRVDEGDPLEPLAAAALADHEKKLYQQVQAVGVVLQKIQDAKQAAVAAKNAADQKLLDDAYGAWIRSRGFRPFEREGFPARQFLDAVGADNLRIIANDLNNVVPRRP